MTNQNIIEQARSIILTAQPDDVEARKIVWRILNEHNLLVGAVRAKPAIEEDIKNIIRKKIEGGSLNSNILDFGTRLVHIILNKPTLLQERLALKENELPQARKFFLAMDQDIQPKDNI